jgi:hypothetical protein
MIYFVSQLSALNRKSQSTELFLCMGTNQEIKLTSGAILDTIGLVVHHGGCARIMESGVKRELNA